MKPGDMIEWTYKYSGDLVDKDEILWSSVMKRFVPVCSEMVHLLVLVDDKTYSWINAEGLFHAREGDSVVVDGLSQRRVEVVPRARANP